MNNIINNLFDCTMYYMYTCIMNIFLQEFPKIFTMFESDFLGLLLTFRVQHG